MTLVFAIAGWVFVVGLVVFAVRMAERRARRASPLPDAPVRVTFVTWDADTDLPWQP